MAITLATGEALVGEGNEVAHIDLLLGSKNGPVGAAFAHAFVNESEGHTNLLAVVTGSAVIPCRASTSAPVGVMSEPPERADGAGCFLCLHRSASLGPW